jgi:hypothetical protein
MPSILTKVTHRWRDLAIGHPVLWTELHLSQFNTRAFVFDTDSLEAVLARSEDHALHIHLDFLYVDSSTLAQTESLHTILQHMTRCWRLTVIGNNAHYYLLYKVLYGYTAPLLKQLELYGTETAYRLFTYSYHFPTIHFDPQRLPHVYIDGVAWELGIDQSLHAVKTLEIRNSVAHYVGTNPTSEHCRDTLAFKFHVRCIIPITDQHSLPHLSKIRES